MFRISTWHAVGAAVLAFAVVGCSSGDSTSNETTTTEAPAPTGGSGPDGDLVEIPQVVLSNTDLYAEGTAVSVGQTADADGVLITVASISPGTREPDPAGDSVATIDVDSTVENSTNTDLAGPDFYTVCADDGRFAIALDSSEIASLAPVAAGESVNGLYFIGVPDDCNEVLLQARILSTQGGTDHIAQWSVPPEALE